MNIYSGIVQCRHYSTVVPHTKIMKSLEISFTLTSIPTIVLWFNILIHIFSKLLSYIKSTSTQDTYDIVSSFSDEGRPKLLNYFHPFPTTELQVLFNLFFIYSQNIQLFTVLLVSNTNYRILCNVLILADDMRFAGLFTIREWCILGNGAPAIFPSRGHPPYPVWA